MSSSYLNYQNQFSFIFNFIQHVNWIWNLLIKNVEHKFTTNIDDLN